MEKISAWLRGLAVAASLAAFAVLAASAPTSLRDAAIHLGMIRERPLSERVVAAFEGADPEASWRVPGILRAAELLEPARAQATPLELRFVLVTSRGDEAALEGIRRLIYCLAPAAWPIPLTMKRVLAALEAPPGSPLSQSLLLHLQGAEVFLFHDVSAETLQELRQRLADHLGEGSLVMGRSLDGRHHLAFLRPLVERIQSGDPKVAHYRVLLP